MKIFVAGSTGAIGRLLLPKLVQAGHKVIGMTHNKSNKDAIQQMGARAIIADAFDRERMISAIGEVQPEVVIHQLTSLSNWNLADNARIRIEGTRNLVDAMLAAGVTRIIAQSISWAYEPGKMPASEDVSMDVGSPMPRKSTIDGVIALEQAVAEIPHHVILRYGMLYGQGTWYDHKGMMAEKVLHKGVEATEGVTSFLHVEDAAAAALLALDWPSGPVNIVDDEPAAGVDWLPVYANALKAPKPEFKPGRNRGERGASNALARKVYGWVPLYPTWRSGFAQDLNPDNYS
ncbi:nucleoside-diphosphate-sugar epimerase [Paenibacillus castaneae]|uniref:NAD-dependent epimerase/dehydratase family protein n=1 Tax=Paenibacillus castaneae TaxID=474957 RepID=UPI000C9C75F8|nr:NAD(P)-dependent oxidoreductase [Paenibacillus castaneae]NIK75250.1 nucleoside-diphosphate-sugar epimerase [Paenibacillus castaneae]